MKYKKKEEEILQLLLTLSNISNKKSKEYPEEMTKYQFKIREYNFTLYFIYNSLTINIWHGSNFHIFVFIFHDEKHKITNDKEIKKFLNIVHISPDLIINELNKIGVNEI